MIHTTRMLSGKGAVHEAATLLERGECVAIPTETVYGLAAKADDPEAIAKIFDAKNRPKDHPLIIHISNVSEAKHWASDLPQDFYKLAHAFWPGPLTMVLKKSAQIPYEMTAGLETIALRIPSHPMFLELLKLLGRAVVAPSANMHKALSTVTAEQVLSTMNGRISAVLDGGRCTVGLESTIVDLSSDQPCILRAGPLARKQLECLLGKKVILPARHSVKISGNMQAHYQPNARLYILNSDEIRARLRQKTTGPDFFLIQSQDLFEENLNSSHVSAVRLRMSNNSRDYAHDLYHTLAQLDHEGAENIFVELPPQTDEWLAINDRLNRAQGGLQKGTEQ